MLRPTQAGALALLALLALFSVASCAGRRAVSPPVSDGSDGFSALYRARIEPANERGRKFRLLLYVDRPDRLHAEVLTPLGSTALIADSGNGRIAVSVVRTRTAYVGASSAEVLERLVGVRIGAEELIGALLGTGTPAGDPVVRRIGPPPPALPDTLEIESGGNRLFLELKRRRVPGPVAAGLATGAPPPGFEVRPVADLGASVTEEFPPE